MKRNPIWEKVTLGVGILAIAAMAVGLGYKAGDYALSHFRETRAAKAELVPKPPMMVKKDGASTATMGQGDSPLLKVMVSAAGKAEAEKVVAKIAGTGYGTYVLPDGTAVQVGAFHDRAKAQAVLESLSKIGIKAEIE